MEKTQRLCCDSFASQGAAERMLATVAPNLNSTNNEGRAQQTSALASDEKRDTYCNHIERVGGDDVIVRLILFTIAL
jgi:hypothetical protein